MKQATSWKTNNGSDIATSTSGAMELEDGFYLLLQDGSRLLLETTQIIRKAVGSWSTVDKNKTAWQNQTKETTEWVEL